MHPWTLDADKAIQIQLDLRQRLIFAWDGRRVATVGGVDVSYTAQHACAAIVVLRYPELGLLATATGRASLDFPYIPGLLAFREGPAILAAWEKLPLRPDLLLFDGHGLAHPRGCGIASHLGLWLETPSIGVAKSHLYGWYADAGPQVGDWSPIWDEDHPEHAIGAVLRTKTKTRPVYVSPGHLIDLEGVLRFVLRCCRGYRLPEPIRWAHRFGKGGEKV
jgi:deoxyribonuclease V